MANRTNTINQMVLEFERICGPVPLLEMDRRALAYLAEHDGRVPSIGIPARLFSGSEDANSVPNMVELGLIQHDGDFVVITERGRASLRAGAAQ